MLGIQPKNLMSLSPLAGASIWLGHKEQEIGKFKNPTLPSRVVGSKTTTPYVSYWYTK